MIGFCSPSLSFADTTVKDKAQSEQLSNATHEDSMTANDANTLISDQNALPHSLDWHPIEELTYEQKLYLKPGCAGAYIDPSINPINEQSRFISDRFLLENENSELNLPTEQQPL